MNYRVSKKDKSLKGKISLTSSKSISNRLLIIQALCTGKFRIENLATANDTVLLQQLLGSHSNVLDAQDAGTTFRFLTAYLSQKPGAWLLTGTERMQQRPVGILVDALRKIGAEISYGDKEGFPPLKITGKKLFGGEVIVDGSVSSQYISALLLIAPTLEEGLKIQLKGEVFSRSYIEMTLKLMHEFGIEHEWNGNIISISHQLYKPKDITVEADWSAASYWYEMAALADEVDLTLTGLNINSIQGDSVIAEILKSFGLETEYKKNKIRITKKTIPLPEKFIFNVQSCPDLLQTLAVTCAALGVEAEFSGIKNLRIKETDRLQALQNELEKIGSEIKISNDQLSIFNSQLRIPDSILQTYNDHRMAMSLAPLALKLGEVEIDNPEVVKKSYPDFWSDLKKVGFEVEQFKTGT
jgi:3-phosphoshikimate 1-carboxyvinyltransferase